MIRDFHESITRIKYTMQSWILQEILIVKIGYDSLFKGLQI